MIARTYVMGQPKFIEVNDPHSAVIEIELDDGRTVQLVVNKDGTIYLRGWGNIPGKVGNSNKVEFVCELNKEPQTHCHICYNELKEKDRCCGLMKE